MTLYVFQHAAQGRTFALTDDQEGSQLPTDLPAPNSKWVFWKEFEEGFAGRIAFGLEDEATAKKDIAKQGYHIFESGRILRRGS